MLDGVDVHGLDRAGSPPRRRKMGMLFQHGALFTDLNVYENVAFPLREHTDLSGRDDPRPGADEAACRRPAWCVAADALGDLRRHGAARRAGPLDRRSIRRC